MPLLWYQETRPEAGAVVVQADSRFLDSPSLALQLRSE
jgi:hypothetical protein